MERTPTVARPARLRWLTAVFHVNATLVICHEIDSACWAEWELFRIPGGAPVFVALHLLVVPLLLVGLVQLVRGGPAARWLALLIGLAGAAGGATHTMFLVAGDPRFATPFSLALIAGFALSSLLLVGLVLACWRLLGPGTAAKQGE